jgi:hypothetical protein
MFSFDHVSPDGLGWRERHSEIAIDVGLRSPGLPHNGMVESPATGKVVWGGRPIVRTSDEVISTVYVVCMA